MKAIIRVVVLPALVAVCVAVASGSTEPEPAITPSDCRISFEVPPGSTMEFEDESPPVVCGLVIGPAGWREQQENSDSTYPKYSLRVWVVSGGFPVAAGFAGFTFDFKPPGGTYQLWPRNIPTPPPHEHPTPEAAPYWCTPVRMGTVCGPEFVTGEQWSGYVAEVSWGFHTPRGYGGTVEGCRAVVEGPNDLCVAIEGIGGCRGTRAFLETLRFDGPLAEDR
jgi:hypothetical protein